jgi:hypothetical protein
MERNAEALFNKYKKKLLKKFGNRALYDHEIDRYGRANIKGFSGVYSHDRVPNKSGRYIVNTGNHKSAGIHWVGLVRTSANDYAYDSFSRHIKKVIKKGLGGSGRSVVQSDVSDAEQNDSLATQQNICGHLSLAWLHVVADLGIGSALLI